MRVVYGGLLSVLLVLGCRTSQPDLKPPKQPEEFNSPPQEARFNSYYYPKEALARDDLSKRMRDLNQAVNPKGMGGMGGMGGMSPGGR